VHGSHRHRAALWRRTAREACTTLHCSQCASGTASGERWRVVCPWRRSPPHRPGQHHAGALPQRMEPAAAQLDGAGAAGLGGAAGNSQLVEPQASAVILHFDVDCEGARETACAQGHAEWLQGRPGQRCGVWCAVRIQHVLASVMRPATLDSWRRSFLRSSGGAAKPAAGRQADRRHAEVGVCVAPLGCSQNPA
jgi:hypothetical protein